MNTSFRIRESEAFAKLKVVVDKSVDAHEQMHTLTRREIVESQTKSEIPENWTFIDLTMEQRFAAPRRYNPSERCLSPELRRHMQSRVAELHSVVQLAHDAAIALEPWGAVWCDDVEWTLCSTLPLVASLMRGCWSDVDLFISQQLESWSGISHLDVSSAVEDSLDDLPSYTIGIIKNWLAWELAAELGCPFAHPRRPWLPSPSEMLADWPNPFSPALEIWNRGYMLFSQFTPENLQNRVFVVLGSQVEIQR